MYKQRVLLSAIAVFSSSSFVPSSTSNYSDDMFGSLYPFFCLTYYVPLMYHLRRLTALEQFTFTYKFSMKQRVRWYLIAIALYLLLLLLVTVDSEVGRGHRRCEPRGGTVCQPVAATPITCLTPKLNG
ncbi:hypothetical protein BDZ97DRAFT_158034 [Flammula alnicola]|nr:hypothetical protein BDZ97DRAFT_158034 [Flammula alnicola]